MDRRNLIKFSLGSWVTPVIITVHLPVHAVTSECSEGEIIGPWLYSGTNYGFILKANGFTDDGDWGGDWSVSGNKIQIRYNGNDFLIRGELTKNCTEIVGTRYDFDWGTEEDIVLVKK